LHSYIDFDFYTKLERSTMNQHTNTKNEIDGLVADIIRRDVASGKLKAADNEKLLALRKRIIEDVRATNTRIRTWFKKSIKRILTGK
jgi:hypothetical protein